VARSDTLGAMIMNFLTHVLSYLIHWNYPESVQQLTSDIGKCPNLEIRK